ncbi:MAG: hypothetical protein Q8900_04435 [Bacillota bacterium]|nr:hypothetical protein [Bacillota bacterium]
MFRLGLDIDGCINDFNKIICKYIAIFNEGYGINKDFDLSDYHIQRYFGWTECMNSEFWAKFYKQALINTMPQQGAVQAISLLKNSNIEIYIVTARDEQYRELTSQWLNTHGIMYDKLIMSKYKAAVCVENDIDLMVDDETENCITISKHIPVICMSYPYNDHLERSHNIKRVTNWVEIYNEITCHIKQRQVV